MMLDYPIVLTIVEGATVIVTFVMIASGFPGCLKMYRNKSTDNVPFLLFLMSCLVSSFSLQYGMMMKNRTLVFINVVAVLVWSAYASVYIFVSKSKTLPVVTAISVGAMYWAHLYYLGSLPSKSVIPTLGNYMVVWCTVAYLIPAGEILTMVREKSARSCDLSLLLGGTLSASVWYLYGFLVNDTNIYLPTIPAILISACKFFLLFLYGNDKKTSEVKKAPKNSFGPDFHDGIYKVKGREGLRQRN